MARLYVNGMFQNNSRTREYGQCAGLVGYMDYIDEDFLLAHGSDRYAPTWWSPTLRLL
jgi:hypothetical protein